jgi:hypothetical protein
MHNYRQIFRNCLLIVLVSLSLGCAEDVSNQSGAVKSDLALFTAELSIAPDAAPSLMTKASTVSATARFTGVNAQKTRAGFETTVLKMGYVIANTQPIGALGLHEYCHRTQVGRNMYVLNEVEVVTVGFRVSGWKEDRTKCSGQK